MDNLQNELTLCFLNEEVQADKAIRLFNENPELKNSRYFDEEPWLVVASSKGCLPVCKKLVEMDADVNEKGTDFYPLENAINSGSIELIEFLLKSGADPNLGRTLFIASNQSEGLDLQIAKMLIDYGVDVNQVFEIFGDANNCQTALDWSRNNPNFAHHLEKAGAKTYESLKKETIE